jgi:hypothetical protein
MKIHHVALELLRADTFTYGRTHITDLITEHFWNSSLQILKKKLGCPWQEMAVVHLKVLFQYLFGSTE